MLLRDYSIRILTPENELITIEPPFSIIFSITRNTLASVNSCSLKINNLGPSIRSKLFKDRFTINEYWSLIINAGYDRLTTVFEGNIIECHSYKQNTEWITEIEGFDGLFGTQNGFTARTFSKNSNKKDIVSTVISDMPNIIQGVLGSPSEGNSSRGQTLIGNSSDVLNEQTGGKYFIDNETLNIIDDDEYIGESIIDLDSSILYSTPKRRETFLDCETRFFPEATIGYLANLTSLIPEFNGLYKIIGFQHDVEISRSVSGRAVTKINLYAGANVLRKAS